MRAPGVGGSRLDRERGPRHRLVCRPSRPVRVTRASHPSERPCPPMKLVFAGTPEVAVPALDALIASGRHEVAAVVTRPDAPAGRGRRLVASPVAERAEEAGIEVLKPVKPRDPEFLERLREIAPDCCPVVAYGALLPRVALDIPAHGWVNLHFSLLPAWRGAAPVQHSIMAGDEITGASTFLIEEGLDSGPVYG
ncbi:methionyl-tRNA formyltransferase, partial [Streptomyces sviceus ATCC 29083]